MMTLEEKDKLAKTIAETGGVWLLPYMGRKVEVKPVTIQARGRMVVFVKALKGKPFHQKDEYGEGRVRRYWSEYKWVFPEQLETVTPDKATVSDEQTINYSTRSIS